MANKESLVCGGPLLITKAKKKNCNIIPLDSNISETIDARVQGLIQNGTGISWAYLDNSTNAGTLTPTVSLSGFNIDLCQFNIYIDDMISV